MEEKSLDEILDSDTRQDATPTQSDKAPEGQEPEPGKAAEAPEGDKPEGQPEAEQKPAPSKALDDASDSDPKAWQYAAYKDKSEKAAQWRDRATTAELRAAEAERKLAELSRPQPIDPDLDPEGYQKQQRERESERESELRRQIVNERYNTSQILAETQHGKQAVADALEWAQTLPAHEQLAIKEALHPYGDMVERKKRHDALKEVGDDPSAWREAERERLRAEILAEQQGEKPPASTATSMPTNLAGARNAGARTGPAWAGPPSIDDIFANSKR